MVPNLRDSENLSRPPWLLADKPGQISSPAGSEGHSELRTEVGTLIISDWKSASLSPDHLCVDGSKSCPAEPAVHCRVDAGMSLRQRVQDQAEPKKSPGPLLRRRQSQVCCLLGSTIAVLFPSEKKNYCRARVEIVEFELGPPRDPPKSFCRSRGLGVAG